MVTKLTSFLESRLFRAYLKVFHDVLSYGHTKYTLVETLRIAKPMAHNGSDLKLNRRSSEGDEGSVIFTVAGFLCTKLSSSLESSYLLSLSNHAYL